MVASPKGRTEMDALIPRQGTRKLYMDPDDVEHVNNLLILAKLASLADTHSKGRTLAEENLKYDVLLRGVNNLRRIFKVKSILALMMKDLIK